MRVNVDGNQVVLVFVESDLQRVKNEANAGFFKAVKGNEFFLELVSEDFLGGVKWGAHSDLECTSTNDSSAFKAGVLACGLDHGQSTARDSHTADMATLFEPNSLFLVVYWDLLFPAARHEFTMNDKSRRQG